jgi:hypothetical protein
MNHLKGNIHGSLDQIESEIEHLEYQLYVHPFAATEDDYEIVDGEKIYTAAFLGSMPASYHSMLIRFGTLMEVKERLEECLKPAAGEPLDKLRLQITFDNDEEGGDAGNVRWN